MLSASLNKTFSFLDTGPPSILTSALRYAFKEGSTISLDCFVQSVLPIKSRQWTKDDSTIKEGGLSRYIIGNSSHPNLVIQNLKTEDSGTYTCSASNGRGTTHSQNITLDVTCTVFKIIFRIKIWVCVTIFCIKIFFVIFFFFYYYFFFCCFSCSSVITKGTKFIGNIMLNCDI